MKRLVFSMCLYTITTSAFAQASRFITNSESPVVSFTESYTVTKPLVVDSATWQPVGTNASYLPKQIIVRGDTLQVEFRETYVLNAPDGTRYPMYAFRYVSMDSQPAIISRSQLKSIMDRLQKSEQRPK